LASTSPAHSCSSFYWHFYSPQIVIDIHLTSIIIRQFFTPIIKPTIEDFYWN
jgi:hypothetical protein